MDVSAANGADRTDVSTQGADWTDAATGASVSGGAVAVEQVLGSFPVAVLEQTR